MLNEIACIITRIHVPTTVVDARWNRLPGAFRERP